VVLVEAADLPAYQRAAPGALYPRQPGLSDRAIAVRRGVTEKTAARAIRWLASLDLLA